MSNEGMPIASSIQKIYRAGVPITSSSKTKVAISVTTKLYLRKSIIQFYSFFVFLSMSFLN
ncbi:RepB family protein [Patescibacteria group bacterium]